MTNTDYYTSFSDCCYSTDPHSQIMPADDSSRLYCWGYHHSDRLSLDCMKMERSHNCSFPAFCFFGDIISCYYYDDSCPFLYLPCSHTHITTYIQIFDYDYIPGSNHAAVSCPFRYAFLRNTFDLNSRYPDFKSYFLNFTCAMANFLLRTGFVASMCHSASNYFNFNVTVHFPMKHCLLNFMASIPPLLSSNRTYHASIWSLGQLLINLVKIQIVIAQ